MNDAESHSRLCTLAEESSDPPSSSAAPESHSVAEAITSGSGADESAPTLEHDQAALSDVEYEHQ